MQGKWTANFAELLQRLPGERKAIAHGLGVPYWTYRNFVHGIQSFPPDLISRLYAITGERGILDFFLEPLNMHAINRVERNYFPNTQNPDLYRMLLDTMARLGQVTKAVVDAREAKTFGPAEYARVGFFLRDIERLSAEIRELMKDDIDPNADDGREWK